MVVVIVVVVIVVVVIVVVVIVVVVIDVREMILLPNMYFSKLLENKESFHSINL